jgi:hypothetical protein
VNFDADFAGPRLGVGNILIAQNVGRAVFVEDYGFHSRNFIVRRVRRAVLRSASNCTV